MAQIPISKKKTDDVQVTIDYLRIILFSTIKNNNFHERAFVHYL
jgi:hypothetical protein